MAKRLTVDALLTALALIIFVLEAQIPQVVPIPGVKLGLANVITVYAMFAVGAKDAFAILIVRIALGSIFSGQLVSFLFSLSGGILCFLIMLVMKRIVSEKQIWVCSVVAAVFHNIGQILVAMLIFSSGAVIIYLPVLIASGIVTGAFTGLCAQTVYRRIKNNT